MSLKTQDNFDLVPQKSKKLSNSTKSATAEAASS